MPNVSYAANNPFVQVPNLDEDCPICLDKFRERVPEDRKTYRQLAETQCHHFFHQFCLQEHLDHGNNTNCPICRGPALEYSIIDLDPNIKEAVESRRNAVSQPNANQAQNNPPEEVDLAADMVNVGGAILSGLGSLAWGTAKLGGSLLYHAAAAGANAVASSLIETPEQFDARVQKLYRKWTQMTSNLESTMCRNKEDISVILATIRSIPEASRYRARPSVERIEAAMEYFEKTLQDNQKQLKQIFIEEQRNLSIR